MSIDKLSQRITAHLIGLDAQLNPTTVKLLNQVNSVLLQQEGKISDLESIIEEIRDIHTDKKYFDEIDRDIKVDEILARMNET